MMRWLVFLFLLLPPVLVAQTNESDLRARLVDQPLYLRGLWQSDNLSFDPAGRLIGSSNVTSFTLSGIEIQTLHLSGKTLRLGGSRVGIRFDPGTSAVSRIELMHGRDPANLQREAIRIEIKAPASGDFTATLDEIFSPDLRAFLVPLPSIWQTFAGRHAALMGSTPVTPAASSDNPPAVNRIGGNASGPRVLHAPEPEFSEQARTARVGGNVLVSLHVDSDGQPSHIAIVRPLGMGLDEKAVEAVAAYRFKPAERDGVPVAVELNISVNFQIF